MSVPYDYDPGRLELYRPRADGLMSRCFCGSVLIHLLVACILIAVRLPETKPAKRRPYRITEVRLLPRSYRRAPLHAEPSEPKKVAELGPKDLSLFLHDLTPAEPPTRRPRRRRPARPHALRTAALPRPALSSELKPEGADAGTKQPVKPGPVLAEGLPGLLEKPMAQNMPLDLHPDALGAGGSSRPTLTPKPRTADKPERPKVEAIRPKPRKLTELPAPKPVKPAAPKPEPVVPTPPRERKRAASKPGVRPKSDLSRPETVEQERPSPTASIAPKPVKIARAEPPLSEPLPKPREESSSIGPLPAPVERRPPTNDVDRPMPQPVEHAAPTTHAKRVAELPGSLSGDGSGQGSGPSNRTASLPEGRPGAAEVPGPRRPALPTVERPRPKRVKTPVAWLPPDSAGIDPIPSASGVRLPAEERPDGLRHGAPSDERKRDRSTRVAALPPAEPPAAPEISGRGSAAAPTSTGGGGGYGTDAPRSFGGREQPVRPARQRARTVQPTGDGGAPPRSGGGERDPDLGSGIDISGAGSSSSITGTSHRSGAHSTGSDGGAPGKRIARADLPGLSPTPSPAGRGEGGGRGRRSGAESPARTGPRSFDTGGKRRVTPENGDDGPGAGTGRGRSKGGGDGDGDAKGVALPRGGGGDDDNPGRDSGDEGSDVFKKGRTQPAGVYVSTTGRFTLPGAIYQGDFQYHSRSLRKLMDELNSRTKVKVQLGGQYESIAPGSFQKAPVVVFSGHKAFELTDEQRKVLKEYVDRGGMVWADLSHSAFDASFRNEMEKTFGRAPSPLPSGHAIYRSFYILHGPPPSDLGDDAPFEGISVGDRLGVVITPNRYLSAVAHTSGVSEEVQEGAIQAVVNIYMYAAGNYRAVKDAGD